MFSRFSVKKPLTVFVGVIIVLILGVVSFSRMTPDLLPNINLPYAVVITAYPGATPEKVESEISKPLEQAMATLDNIDSVTSTSSENASVIMIGFTDEANMDTLVSDIREKINGVSGAWDELVQTPVIMKINPNLLPVMVASMNVKGMDSIEITDLLENGLLTRLEGIAGVASVSLSGNVEESVNVTLSQKKIDAVNDKIKTALDIQFGNAEDEIASGQAELDNGFDEMANQENALSSQENQLKNSQDQLIDQAAEAQTQLIGKKIEIKTALSQLDTQLNLLNTVAETLRSAREELSNLIGGIGTLREKIEKITAQIENLQLVSERYTELQAKKSAAEADIDLLKRAGEEENAQEIARLEGELSDIESELSTMDATLAAADITAAEADQMIAQLQTALATAQQSLEEARGAAVQAGFDPDMLENALAELDAQISNTLDGIEQMKSAKSQLESGAITVDEALTELNRQQSNGLLQISSAYSQMASGKSALSSAKAQLEVAQEQLNQASGELESQKETAYANADFKLTMAMISQILSAQDFDMPAGYVDDDGEQTLVRVGNEIEDMDELSDLMLYDTGLDGVGKIYLKDVAEVEFGDNSDELYAKLDGNDAVILSFSKQSNYSTAEVSENIAKRFEELSAEYEGMDFTVLSDQGDYIHIVINTVLENLVLGAILAVLILLLFLKDIRPTVVIAFSIPISLLMAIVLMYFSGVTMNVISLSGLAVGVGMLVDNSVVVIENITRFKNNGESAAKAAVQGAVQVTGAVIASTLTTVCVFMPIVFVEGITRQIFSDMALTIAYSLLSSLFVAITLVPAMTSGFRKPVKERKAILLDKMLAGYEKLQKISLNHKWFVISVSVILLVLSVTAALSKGFIFMPSMSGKQIRVTVTPPEENSFEQNAELSDVMLDRISAMPDVETVGAFAGGSGISILGSSSNGVSMYVIMKDGAALSDMELSRQIISDCADLNCDISASGAMDMTSMLSSMTGSGVSVKVFGDDMDTLISAAEEIGEIIGGVEGTESVENGVEDSTPELRIVVDKNKAMEKGLTTAQVYQSISAALTESATAMDMEIDNVVKDVIIVNQNNGNMDRKLIENYVIKTTNSLTGASIEAKLSDIAEFEDGRSLSSINRENQRRLVTVSSGVADGYNVTLVTNDVRSALENYTPPDGVTVEIGGENETIMEAMSQLMLMALLAVILIYLIMVIQFQSLLSPFIVMFTIPLAFTGGFAALWLCGLEVSVVSAIGFIMLAGIIVNNGIVLIDYINQLRDSGTPRREAIIEAGKTRMRPILMTVLTTVLGLLFMALATGLGAELMQPIAIVCIGGLIYATLMTLFVVPALYDLLNRKERKKRDI